MIKGTPISAAELVQHLDEAKIKRAVVLSTAYSFNNGASVVLHSRFELIDRDLMIEHATLPDGTPVSTIVLHRVSQD